MGYPVAERNSFLTAQIAGTMQIALWTVAPNDEGVGGTEVTGGGYARVLHSAWNVAANGLRTNNGEIDFGDPSADWGTIVAITHHTNPGGVQKSVTADISQVIQASANSVKILDTALIAKFTTTP